MNGTKKIDWRNGAKKQILMFLILLTVACGKSEDSGSSEIRQAMPTTADSITLLFGVPGAEMDGYAALAEAFTIENPTIHIQLVSLDGRLPPTNTPDRYRQIAQTTDAFVYNSFDSFGIEQAALELSPWVDISPDFAPDDFYPDLLAKEEGSLWGVPLAATTYLVYYDVALFDAAGIEVPTPDWSWETFGTMAQALTLHDGGEVKQWGFVPTDLWNVTTPLLAGTTVTTLPAFTDDKMLTQVEWLTAFFTTSFPWFDTYGQADVPPTPQLQLISDQKAAMWVADQSFAWDNRRGGVTVAPYPSGLLGDGVPMRVQQAAISSGTAHPEEVWQWIAFLSHQMPVRRGVPARRSVTAVSGYWDTLDEPLRVAVQQSVERGFPFTPHSPMQMALDTAVVYIVNGDETVATALQIAQETAANQLEMMSTLPEESLSVIPPLPEAAPEKTSIVFMAADAPYDFMSPYPALVEAFTTEMPNIEVELRNFVF
ncbi:MAG: carbohydrate ABC transporter substrate-binding protein, partial [Chloroflexi bacterium]|nr:carbohydrate ABC transporter substrate-binding protein [Chloroflexota bacterium]